MEKIAKSFIRVPPLMFIEFHVSSSTLLKKNLVVNNLKSTKSRTQLIIVTDNCSICTLITLIIFKISWIPIKLYLVTFHQLQRTNLYWTRSTFGKTGFITQIGENEKPHQNEFNNSSKSYRLTIFASPFCSPFFLKTWQVSLHNSSTVM